MKWLVQAPVQILLERIHRRARDFEQRIPPTYLQQLNERCAAWVERFRLCPILTVDTERLDLAHLDSLVEEMQARLPSLFPLNERCHRSRWPAQSRRDPTQTGLGGGGRSMSRSDPPTMRQ